VALAIASGARAIRHGVGLGVKERADKQVDRGTRDDGHELLQREAELIRLAYPIAVLAAKRPA